MESTGQEIIAVDTGLLLPDVAGERVQRLNALLYSERPDGFLFGPTAIPHVSLAQLFVKRCNLLALIERLDKIFRETAALPLSVTKIAGSGKVVVLRIGRTPELFRLHALLMDEVKTLSEAAGGIDAFFSNGQPARPRDVKLVALYRAGRSYRRFVPHITLGYGLSPVPDLHLDFTSSEAGLFHLGRFCTCRQLLHHWELH